MCIRDRIDRIQKKVDSNQRFVIGAGAVLATLGLVAQIAFPIYKTLTTSSQTSMMHTEVVRTIGWLIFIMRIWSLQDWKSSSNWELEYTPLGVRIVATHKSTRTRLGVTSSQRIVDLYTSATIVEWVDPLATFWKTRHRTLWWICHGEVQVWTDWQG